MISKMVGRTLQDIYPTKSGVFSDDILKIEGLSSVYFRNVNLTVRAGEIVGLGGLEGQGQREFVRAVYGCLPTSGGSITVSDKAIKGMGVKKRVKANMTYVTSDRRGEGIITGHSIKHNMTIASLPSFLGVIDGKREKESVSQLVENFQIKISSTAQGVETLSGGNQQKVVLARFVMPNPKVLIIDEPTLGIDVGSRMAIYQLIRDLADSGMGVLMVTSDMLELIGLSDRIAVFYNGEVFDEFSAEEATEERIMASCSGTRGEKST